MKILPGDLPNDIDSLKALLLEQSFLLGEKDSALTVKDNQFAEWASKYERILEQWRLAQQKQFGKDADVSPGQGELLNESDDGIKEDNGKVKANNQTVSYTRTKPKRSLCRRTYLVKHFWWI